MYRLQKIELNGFKSFTSATQFAAGPGITAIVGPNGCGKSNIADAIHWVIGEQRTRTLRAEHMGDVIFNGTDRRKAMGLAEVSLHLNDLLSAARLPGEGGGNGGDPVSDGGRREVAITRRLFRSGESEYLIDGQRCRLRDVQDLLAEIGVGTGIYTIIEQGKVDTVITAKPRERRVLIEEAAGIALYKVRKRQAQTKLEATEANLLRINDIVGEIERQINSLKRQAARARRYARLTEAIDRAERILIREETIRLDRVSAAVGERRAESENQESEAAAVLGREEARLETGREEMAAEAARSREARDALHSLDRTIDSLKAKIERWREEETEASVHIDRSREERERLEGRLSETEARRLHLQEEQSAAAEEADRTDSRLVDLESGFRLESATLEEAESALECCREDLASNAGELTEVRGRIQRLEDLLARCESDLDGVRRGEETTASDGVAVEEKRRRHQERHSELRAAHGEAEGELRAVTEARERASARREAFLMEREEKRGRLAALEERLAALRSISEGRGAELEGMEGADRLRLLRDILSPPEHLDRAVDAALKALLKGFLVPTTDQAVFIVETLKARGRGRAVLVPESGREGSPEGLLEGSDEGTLRRLLDPGRSLPPALGRILGRILVAEDLRRATALRSERSGLDIVTLNGDFLSRDGWMEGGAEVPEEAGVMTLKRLLEKIAGETASTRSRIGELEEGVSSAELRGRELAREESTWREREESLRRELEGIRLRDETLEEEAGRIALRREAHAGERARLEEDSRSFRSDLGLLGQRSRELADREESLHRRLESGTGSCDELRGRMRKLTADVNTLRESAAAARERRAGTETALRHQEELLGEIGQRIEKETEEQDRWSGRLEESRRRQEADEVALADRMAERILAEGTVASVESALATRRQALSELEAVERECRGRLETIREHLHGIALEEERIAGDRRNLESRVAERGWAGLEEAVGDLTEEEAARDTEEVRVELGELRSKRDAMGAVNLMAMEEFRELEERHTFIVGQRRDLEESIRSLRETIARINRQSRERFNEAFEKIREGFGELFKTLFGGGRADLKLAMDGEGESDILEAGLEITAQPPGKRLQSISLLSGGEKALTAIALLFAIFRYSPSPFCLLDEVDAPLDEANVLRFVRLLKTMSAETQFIIVTHNRLSMEAADMLYGITMEEPGVSRTVSIVMGTAEERREIARTLPDEMAARHRGNGRGARVPGRPAPRADA